MSKYDSLRAAIERAKDALGTNDEADALADAVAEWAALMRSAGHDHLVDQMQSAFQELMDARRPH